MLPARPLRSARFGVIGTVRHAKRAEVPLPTDRRRRLLPDTGVALEGQAKPRRRFSVGIVYTGGSQAIMALAGAAATYVVARSLGPVGTGAYAAASTLLGLLFPLSILGLDFGIAYYVSQRRWSPLDAFADIRLASLSLGLAAALVGIAAWLIVPDAFRGLDFLLVAVVVIALPAALFWGLTGVVALAVGRYAAAAAPAAGCAILTLALTIVLTPTDGVAGAVIAITLGQVATAAAMLIWAQRQRGEREWSPRDPTASRVHRLLRATRFGFPVYTSQVLQVLNNRLDLFLVIGFAGSAAGGRYGVALSLTVGLLLVPHAVGYVLLPRLAQLEDAVDAEAARRAMESRALRHVVVVNLLAVVAMVLFLTLLVPVVYGSAFEQTTVLGLILVPGTFAMGLAETLGSSLVGRGRTECARRVTFTVTPITLALYIVVIPTLHATGAAVASTVSYTLTFLLWARWYRRYVDPNLAAVMRPSAGALASYRDMLTSAGRALARRVRAKRR